MTVVRPIPASKITQCGWLLGPLLVATAYALMLWATWLTWPDVLIDFGRELYVPWQLSMGQVLYRDIAYFNGPLSPYFNAAIFAVLSPSLHTLVAVNITLAVAILAMLYRLLWRMSSHAAATVGCIVCITMFAFGRYDWVGSTNYICPYAHEMVHGLLLCLAALALLDAPACERSTRTLNLRLALGSLCIGLALLTKLELALAALAGPGLLLACRISAQRRFPNGRPWLGTLAWTLPGIVLPAVVAIAALSFAMAPSRAVAAVFGYALHVDSGVSNLLFYRRTMGIDAPAINLLKLAGYSALWAAAAGIIALVARAMAGRSVGAPPAKPPRIAPLTAVATAAWAALLWFDIPWLDLARPLPVVCGAIIVWQVRRPHAATSHLTAAWAAMSLALLLKMLLRATVYDYGFVLAMPAAMLTIVFAIDRFPHLLGRRGRPLHERTARWLATGLIATVIVAHLRITLASLEPLTVPVASGADRFYSDQRGTFVNNLLDQLTRNTPPDATIAAMPEGVMINYLARRRNPTPHINLMPPEIIMFGESEIAATYREHPPDYLILVHKDTSEYGYRWFGHDYGRDLLAWVDANYQPLALIGSEPFVDRRFGMRVLGKRATD